MADNDTLQAIYKGVKLQSFWVKIKSQNEPKGSEGPKDEGSIGQPTASSKIDHKTTSNVEGGIKK